MCWTGSDSAGGCSTSVSTSLSTWLSTWLSTSASVPRSVSVWASANDDRLPVGGARLRAEVAVLDALLQQHDALDERLGPRGQPGTYTSTGMIWSTPLVTEYESQYGPPQFAHDPIEITYFGSGICS